MQNNKIENASNVECRRSDKADKLNKATANLLLKLTQLNNEEFEQAVTDMMRQIQVLPDNERMICNNYYLNLFDIARELRENGFTAYQVNNTKRHRTQQNSHKLILINK